MIENRPQKGVPQRKLIRLIGKYIIATALFCGLAYGVVYLVFLGLDRSALGSARQLGIPVDPLDLHSISVAEKDNAAPLYREAITALRQAEPTALERSMNCSPDAAPISSLNTLIRPYLGALELAGEGATKPQCDFEHDVRLGYRFSAPEYVPMKRLVSLECAAAQLDVSQGREHEALRRITAAQRIAYDIGSDRNFDSQECSIAAKGIVNRALLRIVDGGPARLTFLGPLRHILDSEPAERPIKFYAEGDLVLNRVLLHQIPGMTIAEVKDLLADAGDPNRAELEKMIRSRMLNPLFDANFVSFYSEFLRALPSNNTDWAAIVSAGTNADQRSSQISIPSMFTAAFSKQLKALASSAVKCETRTRLLDAVVRILEQRASSGSLPTSMPDLGASCCDPFSGKQFKYQRVRSGFRVFSVGPEGNSDGKRNTEDLVCEIGVPKPPHPKIPVGRLASGLRMPPVPPESLMRMGGPRGMPTQPGNTGR